jgi:RNA polymerase sigma-70 factor (ECF subfamily)
MPEAKDEDLLIAAGQGDRTSFSALVERHHRSVLSFIYRFLSNVDSNTAEDLAQDVFLSAWKSAPRFQPRAKVSTWLLRITTNACLNHQRSRRLRRAVSLGGIEAEGKLAARGDTGEARMSAGEREAEVRRAVAGLPSAQRAAIVLRHYENLAYAEIAEVLEVSVSAVESLLFRARKSLRNTLGSESAGESPQVLPELGAESL